VGAADLDPTAPPATPLGWVSAPPDFVGLGVQKAGTTWWYDTLSAHPQVHHPEGRPKELHFFDRFWGEACSAADIATYHRWFARPPGTVAGEWTPRYLHDWWSPPLVVAAAPAARLLVLLRDPLERYRSGVAHELRSRGRRDPAIPGDALRRSCYGAQLERLLELVPADRILVQQFERCVEQPERERAVTWDWLGLDAGVDAPIPPATNVTASPAPSLPDAALVAAARELSADLRVLMSLPFELDLDRWPSSQRLLAC
jgi:hypothetical protein